MENLISGAASPPHSVDAEQSVLGCLLVDNSGWGKISDRISKTDFYLVKHQIIFQIIAEFAEKGRFYDAFIISDALKERQLLEQVGELYPIELAKNVGTAVNVKSYADAVKEKSLQRNLISYAEQMQECARTDDAEKMTRLIKKQADDFRLLQEIRNPTEAIKLKVVDVATLLKQEFKARELILSPWFATQSISMIYSPRGIGKTFVGLSIAHAIASSSSFLGWVVGKPRGVLYLDGEMPGSALQERVANIVKASKEELKAKLMFLTPDMQDEAMPDLGTEKGQQKLNEIITDDIEVVIVDNLSCLVRTGKENEGESWLPVQKWALELRRRGISVLFIHHAGKNGQQRGSSRREDILDTVISLRRPIDYEPSKGACFEVHFEKTRSVCGDAIKPLEAQLSHDENGLLCWITKPLEDSTYDRIISLKQEGLSQKEIAEELQINKSTVSRHLKRAQAEGLMRTDCTVALPKTETMQLRG